MLLPAMKQETTSDAGWRSSSTFSAAFGWILRLGDPVVLALTGVLAYGVRYRHLAVPMDYVLAITHGILLALIILNGSSIYRSWRGRGLIAELFKLCTQWVLLFAVMLLYSTLLKLVDDVSRTWVALWFAFSLVGALALRVVVRSTAYLIRSRGIDVRSAVLVGANPDSQRIVDTIRKNPWSGIVIRGWFTTHADRSKLSGVPMLGRLDGLAEYVSSNGIDQVWIALPMREQAQIGYALRQLEYSTADVKYLPDLFGLQLLNHSVEQIAGMPVINLRSSPLDGNAHLLKAIEDYVLASFILLMIAPLMLAIAAAVKLSSPGPILFKQLRHGLDGKPIEVWKFRSMRVHQEAEGQVTQARRDDPRITPIGAFLRRTSLDELPQFLNVLQGTMSIVGPRPHALAHNEQYKTLIGSYMQRHRVKPGITGWAQVNGLRGETQTLEKMARRVEYDLYYLQRWSLGFDLRIILMTVTKGFFGKNAY